MMRISGWRLVAFVTCITAAMGAFFLPFFVGRLLGLGLLWISRYWIEPAGTLRRKMSHRVSAREFGATLALILGLIGVIAAGHYLLGWKGGDDPGWRREPAKVLGLVAVWATLVATGVWKWHRQSRWVEV